MNINPITKTDYPDPDVIRVGDTYYMISTTMYYMPGGVLLRSYDLVNWEIASYIFDSLDDSPSERLEGFENNYGKGMWAACLRYYNNKFYAAFVSHGREDTHLFIADDIDGPWEHRHINEYFHDCSILFDDDGRVFIVSGNMDIRLAELNDDLSGVKKGGIDKIIIRDKREDVNLGYEGAHIYKINGKYYITLIHWPKYNMRRTEAVFVSETIDGDYIGKDVIWDDMGYHNMGVAQGGLVDTPDGDWFAIMFQDSGAVGRVPVLVPVSWENAFPVYGKDGLIDFNPSVKSTRPDYQYKPLHTSDNFESEVIKEQWQWNHVPNNKLWNIKNNALHITTGKTTVNPLFAQNTLTQRMFQPGCQATVTVDASNINNGDVAGIIALEGQYGMLGIEKENNKYFITVIVRKELSNPYKIGCTDTEPGEIVYREETDSSKVTFRIKADFDDMRDEAEFWMDDSGEWKKIGDTHKLRFALDHFTGVRFGLCVFSKEITGGTAAFSDFIYEMNK